jgi:uncharacterized protein YprB with RNaseH-like and TPR domain
MSLLGGNKFGDKFSRIAALRPAKPRVPREFESLEESAIDATALTGLFGATIARNSYGEHLSIRRWFPTPEQCFEARDSRAASALRLLLPIQAKNSGAKQINSRVERFALDPAHWLFLDTETTGLAGGSGTYPFLVGLAWWEGGGLQVEQFFMRDFGEEHALLLSLSKHLAQRRVLVTFNGKSFDWPLLETRYRMTRAIEPPTPAVHLDFLHPARQLWKSRLPSLRLGDLEREILRVSLGSRLDWSRDTDVDSSQIPEIYFNFVRHGTAHPLLPVLHHNQMDLRGLAAIAARILELLSLSRQPGADASIAQKNRAPSIDHDAADLFGLARLPDRRREPASARTHYKAALDAGLPPALARTARRELARLSKRAGDHAGAVEHWESLLDIRGELFPPRKLPRAAAAAAAANSSTESIDEFRDLPAAQSLTLERILLRGAMGLPERRRPRDLDLAQDHTSERLREMLEACEQLAIYFEHRAKNLDRATQLTRHALSLLRRASGSRRVSTKPRRLVPTLPSAASDSYTADPAPRRTARYLSAESFTSRMESRFTRRLSRLERKSSVPNLC